MSRQFIFSVFTIDLLLCFIISVSYTHLRAHETSLHLVCRLLLEKKNTTQINLITCHITQHLCYLFFFLMIRRPPRSTPSNSSAASDVYKRQISVFYLKYFNKWKNNLVIRLCLVNLYFLYSLSICCCVL